MGRVSEYHDQKLAERRRFICVCGSMIAYFVAPARLGCRFSPGTFDNMLGGGLYEGGEPILPIGFLL